MLTWTEQTDGWHATGFRIELAAPFRWLLLNDEREIASVTLEETPLAIARTLTEAKREAELVAAARQRADLRKKHLGILGLLLGLGLLLIGDSAIANVGLLAALSLTAVRSLGVVTGTILWRFGRPQQEFFYQ